MTVTVTVTSQRVTRHAKTPGSTAVKCVTVSTHTDVPLRMPVMPGTGHILDQTVRKGGKPMLGVTTANEL